MATLSVFLFCALSASFVLSHDHEDHILHHHAHHRLLSQKPHGCGYQAPDSATIAKMAIAQEERVARVEQERVTPSQASFPCNLFRSKIKIDTYIHAIQMTDGTGFLSDTVLAKSINEANDLLSSTGFQLNVISTNRVTSNSWYMSKWDSDEQNAKESQYKQGGLDTLNIYYKAAIMGDDRFCGYANMAEDAVWAGSKDGVVMDSGCAADATVLAHEVGHWMNLFHTFDGGCSPGDLVDDTNAQASYHGIYKANAPIRYRIPVRTNADETRWTTSWITLHPDVMTSSLADKHSGCKKLGGIFGMLDDNHWPFCDPVVFVCSNPK